jgi:hypothetical protein
MKTYLLYGFISALAGAFSTLALYFLGFHSDPSKLSAAGWIGSLTGLVITSTCTALGVKARRDEWPAAEDFGYGSALWAGTLIAVVAALLSAIFSYAYYTVINPGFCDLMYQNAASKLEASGMSGDRLEKVEAVNRWMLSPVPQAVSVLIIVLVFGFLVSLVVAAVLKREAPDSPPLV